MACSRLKGPPRPIQPAVYGSTCWHSTGRAGTLHVGARLERDAVTLPPSAAPTEARSIVLALDGGHVKAVRSYQRRSLEVFVAQVSNDNDERVVFSSLPAEAGRQQLHNALHDLWGDIAHAGHHPERRRRRAAILGRGGERRCNPSCVGLVLSR
jgi:hypothetical protein